MLLKMQTRKRSTIFLILSLLAGGGCASKPVTTAFDGQWEFVDRPGQPLKACLGEKDVAKLRELLIRCKAVP